MATTSKPKVLAKGHLVFGWPNQISSRFRFTSLPNCDQTYWAQILSYLIILTPSQVFSDLSTKCIVPEKPQRKVCCPKIHNTCEGAPYAWSMFWIENLVKCSIYSHLNINYRQRAKKLSSYLQKNLYLVVSSFSFSFAFSRRLLMTIFKAPSHSDSLSSVSAQKR